jgi:hypothetical protein
MNDQTAPSTDGMDRPTCFECDEPAVGIFEGTVPPASAVRQPACEEHALDGPPVETFEQDVTDIVSNGGRDADGSARMLSRWTFQYTP